MIFKICLFLIFWKLGISDNIQTTSTTFVNFHDATKKCIQNHTIDYASFNQNEGDLMSFLKTGNSNLNISNENYTCFFHCVLLHLNIIDEHSLIDEGVLFYYINSTISRTNDDDQKDDDEDDYSSLLTNITEENDEKEIKFDEEIYYATYLHIVHLCKTNNKPGISANKCDDVVDVFHCLLKSVTKPHRNRKVEDTTMDDSFTINVSNDTRPPLMITTLDDKNTKNN